MGPLNWTNTARVFDAVKLIYTPVEWLQIDAFGSRVVRNEPTTTDRSAQGDNFYGVYAAYKKIPDHVLDTFLFVRDVNDDSFLTETGGVRGDLAGEAGESACGAEGGRRRAEGTEPEGRHRRGDRSANRAALGVPANPGGGRPRER